MEKQKKIKQKYLPINSGFTFYAVIYLLLERMHAYDWILTTVIVLAILSIIGKIVELFTTDFVSPKDIDK